MKKLVLTIAICGLLYNVAYAWGENSAENWTFPVATQHNPKTQHGKKATNSPKVNEDWNFMGAVSFSVEYREAQERIKNGIKQNNVKAVIKEITKNKDLLYSTDENGNTPLHLAIFEGKFNMVKELVDRGAPLGIRNHKKQTPLCMAAEMKRPRTLKYILKSKNMTKKIVNVQCSNGKNPLQTAADMIGDQYEGGLHTLINDFVMAGAEGN